MIVLVTGSREWRDREAIERDLAELPPDAVVIVGGARGADKIAEHAARRLGLHVARVDALWGHHGRAAGHRRNGAMVKLRPDYALAYTLGTPGTADCIRQLVAARIEVRVRRG